jgi:hypothetical protein
MLTPAQYTALATELNTDPKALGYAANVAAGKDGANANLLNALNGGGTGAVFLTVTMQALLAALTSTADFDLLMAAGVVYNSVQTLIGLGPINFASTAMQAELTHLAVLATLSAGSKTAWTAAVSRAGSRAEVLFGAGTMITDYDVGHALGRG